MWNRPLVQAAAFMFFLVCVSTVLIELFIRIKSVGFEAYASSHLSNASRNLFPPPVKRVSVAVTQLPNVSATSVTLLNRTLGSRLELWTEMGCHSPHPLLACKGKFNVATKSVFYDNRVLHARSASCSMVGSSGSLLNRSYGEDIDSHEVVIRLNGAPIKSFERYVGRRPADIAMINRALKVCPSDISNATLILRMYVVIAGNKDQTKECMDKYSLPIYHVGGIPYSVGQGILQDYRRVVTDKKAKAFTQRPRPSSGLMAAMFCLQICKELHLYGFGWNPGDLYAYYEHETPVKTDHNYYLESTFLEQLSTGEYKNVLRRKLPLQGKWKVYWHG